MQNSLDKLVFAPITIALFIIVIELLPVARQAQSWNRCKIHTSVWLSKLESTRKMNRKGIEAIAVAICNGAVHEPNLKVKSKK